MSAEQVVYGYDRANRVVSAVYPDGTSISYTYDAAGNRLSEVIVAAQECQLDVDEDGELQGPTDGVYIFRALLGVQQVVPPPFRTLDPSIRSDVEIAADIAQLGDALDVDGDGSVQASTDGVYVFRRLIGLQAVVPPLFRQIDPTIPPDSEISATIDAMCSVD